MLSYHQWFNSFFIEIDNAIFFSSKNCEYISVTVSNNITYKNISHYSIINEKDFKKYINSLNDFDIKTNIFFMNIQKSVFKQF